MSVRGLQDAVCLCVRVSWLLQDGVRYLVLEVQAVQDCARTLVAGGMHGFHAGSLLPC